MGQICPAFSAAFILISIFLIPVAEIINENSDLKIK